MVFDSMRLVSCCTCGSGPRGAGVEGNIAGLGSVPVISKHLSVRISSAWESEDPAGEIMTSNTALIRTAGSCEETKPSDCTGSPALLAARDKITCLMPVATKYIKLDYVGNILLSLKLLFCLAGMIS